MKNLTHKQLIEHRDNNMPWAGKEELLRRLNMHDELVAALAAFVQSIDINKSEFRGHLDVAIDTFLKEREV